MEYDVGHWWCNLVATSTVPLINDTAPGEALCLPHFVASSVLKHLQAICDEESLRPHGEVFEDMTRNTKDVVVFHHKDVPKTITEIEHNGNMTLVCNSVDMFQLTKSSLRNLIFQICMQETNELLLYFIATCLEAMGIIFARKGESCVLVKSDIDAWLARCIHLWNIVCMDEDELQREHESLSVASEESDPTADVLRVLRQRLHVALTRIDELKNQLIQAENNNDDGSVSGSVTGAVLRSEDGDDDDEAESAVDDNGHDMSPHMPSQDSNNAAAQIPIAIGQPFVTPPPRASTGASARPRQMDTAAWLRAMPSSDDVNGFLRSVRQRMQ